MTLHVETYLVKMFGNSVIFADNLGLLPMMFQSILFYPDWFFMTWPAELFFALNGDGNHPYLHDLGPITIGWSIVWYISGILVGKLGASHSFSEFVNTERPVLIQLPVVIIAYLLFWHIVIARMIGSLLTCLTKFSYELSTFIRRAVYVLMLTPPAIGLTISTIKIIMYFLR